MLTSLPNLKKRFDDAVVIADQWSGRLQEIYKHFMPNRDQVYETSKGASHTRNLYDGSGIIATRAYVSQMHTGITPIGSDLLLLEAGTEIDENEKDEVNKELMKVSNIVNRAIRESNFHLAMNEAWYEFAASTGVLLCNEGTGDDPLNFRGVSLSHVYPEEGLHGDIETVWRKFNSFPVRNIERQWPPTQFSTKIPQQILEQLALNPNLKIDLIEGTVLEQNGKFWRYVIWYDVSQPPLVDVRLESSPWILFRGFKRANEIRGRGPCDDALDTMQSLNAMAKDQLIAGRLHSNPIFMGAADTIFNPYTVKLDVWSVIPIQQSSLLNLPLQQVPISGKPEYSQLSMADLRNQINKIFFTQPLGDIDPSSRITATEISVRHQENLEQKIPSIGRIQYELLQKLTQRVIYILRKKRIIPPINVNGKEVAVKYKSPLIVSQGIINVNTLLRGVEILQTMLGSQLAAVTLNANEIPQYIAEQLNIDPKLIKSPMDLTQMGETIGKLLQTQTQLPGSPTGGIQQQ